MSSSEPEEPVLVPVGEALDGVMIQALPRDASVTGLFAFVRLAERDGSVGWSVRVTDGLNDEETLGVLAGYLEHLKILAASSWHDSWPTDRSRLGAPRSFPSRVVHARRRADPRRSGAPGEQGRGCRSASRRPWDAVSRPRDPSRLRDDRVMAS